jgi:hypothetical protein
MRGSMFNYILFCQIAMAPLCAVAQQYVDLARVYFLSTPLNRFDSSSVSTELFEYNADLTLPIKLSSRAVFTTGTSVESFRTRLDDSSEEYASTLGLLLKVGLNYRHSERLRMTYMFLPRYSGDGGSFARNDLQLGGLAIGKWKKSEDWTWQFGAMYNRELFGPFVVPLLGFYAHSKESRWEANFMLPASADINYTLTTKMRLGTSFVSGVRSFFMNDTDFSPNDAYWVKSTNELYGYLHWEPLRGLIVQGRIGFSVARKFSLYAIGDELDWALMSIKFGDDRTRLNSDFADGSIFQLRLIYRYYTE